MFISYASELLKPHFIYQLCFVTSILQKYCNNSTVKTVIGKTINYHTMYRKNNFHQKDIPRSPNMKIAEFVLAICYLQ